MKTEATTRAGIAVEAHLRLENGKIAGTVSNRGRTAVRRLTLFATDGRTAMLAGVARARLDGDRERAAPGDSAQSGAAPGCQTACLDTGTPLVVAPGDKASVVMSAAAGMIASPATEVQALAGIVDGLPGFRVGGLVPTRSLVAAFAMPLTLESVDVLPANWSAPAGGEQRADRQPGLDRRLRAPRLPAAAQLKIGAGNASPIGTSAAAGERPQVEIYDWTTSSWSPADMSHPFLLSAGERGPDLVRLRVRGSLYLPGLQVTSR